MKLENYRHYLLSELENRKVRNPHYSLRAFARDLQTSPSRLSEALNGRRGISSELGSKFIKNLGLIGIDAEVFRLSVDAEHARSRSERHVSQQKLREALDSVSETPLKTFTIVDWVADAVLKMNEREPVVDQVKKVALKLDVPQFMVVEALRFLTRLGFISGTKRFKTYLKNRGEGRKLNIDYVQILEQARKSYGSKNSSNFFCHEPILLEKREYEKAVFIMQKALAEIRKLETKTKNSKVFFIANQIFSVEKEG
ncbi:MAG: TIGR02147 family protein [Pseudobdellovibrionaceae bacterium]